MNWEPFHGDAEVVVGRRIVRFERAWLPEAKECMFRIVCEDGAFLSWMGPTPAGGFDVTLPSESAPAKEGSP